MYKQEQKFYEYVTNKRLYTNKDLFFPKFLIILGIIFVVSILIINLFSDWDDITFLNNLTYALAYLAFVGIACFYHILSILYKVLDALKKEINK